MALTLPRDGTARLVVHGSPAPKGSRITGLRKDGTAYTRPASKRERPWTEAVATSALAAVADCSDLPGAPYAVSLVFRMPRPQKPSYGYPSRDDLDKLVRATLDGLVNGELLSDDRHVTELRAVKVFADDFNPPGCDISVRRA